MKILLVTIISVFSISCTFDRSQFICDEQGATDARGRTCDNGVWIDLDAGQILDDSGLTDTKDGRDTGGNLPDVGDAGNDADVVCVPESTEGFCLRLAKDCEAVTGIDNCGVSRVENCGSCTAPESCSDNVCACEPETDDVFCQRLVKNCGNVQKSDNCEIARSADCGVCMDEKICNTTGDEAEENVCACPNQNNMKLCNDAPADCGEILVPDTCGMGADIPVNCGSCPNLETCAMNRCEPDSDSDGVPNTNDNCPDIFNPNQRDRDNDGVGNACDNCPQNNDPNQNDSDNDGHGDVCDNCPTKPNANQADSDNDGVGNFCDNCDSISNANQADSDGDDVGNVCDNCEIIPNSNQSDSDGDDVGNICDNCVSIMNNNQADADNDGVGDACEPCGNNILESGEGCDDGNTNDNDGCNSSCRIENNNVCNQTQPGHIGNASCASGICNTADGSPGSCATANSCGNNILDSGEGCDDGNTIDNDGCNSSCKIEDNNACNQTQPGNIGNASCTSGICNTAGGGAGTCATANSCGNNILDSGEGCDDGNTVDNDGCNSSCEIEDNNACNQTQPGDIGDASCSSGICNTTDGGPGTCATVNTCGNNVLESGEGCDDGNTVDNDRCDSSCDIEDNNVCNQTPPGDTGNASCASGICNAADGLPGSCATANTCGNTILDSGEGCDDGNTLDNDGCNSSCKIENNNACNQTPPGDIGDASCASGNCNPGGKCM